MGVGVTGVPSHGPVTARVESSRCLFVFLFLFRLEGPSKRGTDAAVTKETCGGKREQAGVGCAEVFVVGGVRRGLRQNGLRGPVGTPSSGAPAARGGGR